MLNKWEKELYYCLNGSGGGFLTKLMAAAMHADGKNQAKLAKGFPEFIEAIQRYQNEPGYWERVQKEMEGK